jgi:sec-independent protein translocase protein TatB
MFDFDAGKLILIGIVALIVIGPKELPRVLRQVGQAAAKMRRTGAEFRGQFMDAMREADMEEFKADAAKLADSAKIAVGVDRLADIKAGITSALEAADKPAALPPAEKPAIAPPGSGDSSVNTIALPEPEPGLAANGQARPGAGSTAAEMQALADALKAEMGEIAPPHGEADTAKTQDKV